MSSCSCSSSDISITACIDDAIGYLERLHKNCRRPSLDFRLSPPLDFDLNTLKVWVLLMKTLFLCATNCGGLGGDISFMIEALVRRNTQDVQSAYLTSGEDGLKQAVPEFLCEICDFQNDCMMQSLLSYLDKHRLLGVPDAARLMDLVHSLLDTAACGICWANLYENDDKRDTFKTLKESLMFLKNFILFVTMQGVEPVQLIEPLIYFQSVAFLKALQIYMFWCDRHVYPHQIASREYASKICQLQQKVKPVDPQVRETFIHVFTALKLSRSSSDIPLTLGKNWEILAADILDSLLGDLWDLLHCHTSGFIISVKDQMQKLCAGVTFLIYLLREHQEKFNRLHEKMKDLIRFVVCDVGIVIWSLSPSEMTEGLAKETNTALFHMLENLEIIIAKVSQFYPSVSFPRTNELGSIDFLLENIKELASCETDSIAFLKDQIHSIQEDLAFLRSFLQSIAEQRKQNDRLQALWSRVMEVAYKAELVIDSVMAGDNPDCSSMPLDTMTEEIECLKIEASEIHDMRHYSQAQRVIKEFVRMPSQIGTPASNEFLVDLDDEVDAITSRLERGSKYLDIVSIVGMPGLGKTTMATKVYHNPLIMCYFHIRAWCTVSKVRSKHSLLLQILHGIESPDKCLKMTEDALAELLYKRLRGNRYLIILDDVWDIDAWNSLRESFPEDANGSRILFASRFHKLSLQIKLDSKPHYLRPFTDKESWTLLQNKLFGKEGCPPALSVVGRQIAKNCKGLPLTVAIVAGILATIEQDCWEDVANSSLSLSTVIGTEHCMKTLELSYNHLPDYLKPCLLYFGALPEDQVIPIRKLILLWISEGFVQKTEEKKLEDVADEYLMDLIGRSLVMVTHQRTTGGVKACRIHGLLHEFCVTKAKEERFLQILHGYNEISTFSRSYNLHRLCIYSKEDFTKLRLFFPHLRSLLFFYQERWAFRGEHLFFVFSIFKLLRVLDFGNILFDNNFPEELVLLVHLRYLAIACYSSIPPSISNLSLLETLILILTRCRIVDLPNTIWKMKKLRHLCVMRHYVYESVAGFRFPTDNLELFPDLYDLDSCKLAVDPSSQSIQKIMRKLPSIRRLKCACIGSTYNRKGILVLDYLSRLESLRVDHFYGNKFAFPLNLKKLTLSYCSQPWSEISTIGKLPNLQVLKLLRLSFLGEAWEMKEGEFPNLTFLKLECLDIVRWTASCDNFPPLQKLVLDRCCNLEEVPSCLGEITTIKMIEVGWCHESAISLVKQIQEEQMEMGNEDLKIIIH